MTTEQELRNRFPLATRMIHIARGALRLLRPYVIDRDVKVHMDGLATNEAIHRLLKNRVERAKMHNDIRNETVTARQRAAGVGLYPLRDVLNYVQEWRELVQATRRNVRESFPVALNGVDRNGMIMLGMARLQLRDRLVKAPASELLNIYINAQPRRDDPIALLETEVIEAMLESGSLATNDADLPTLKKLREFVSDCQDMRTPADLPDYEGLAADVDSLRARASAAQVSVINPEHDHEASALYKAQERDLLAAGSVSDRDDMVAVQQELAAASGL
jgi:hypothetical protein